MTAARIASSTTINVAEGSPSPKEVEDWLAWASQRMLALPVGALRPQGYRNFWPDIVPNVWESFGANPIRLRIPAPPASEIPFVDEILALPALIPEIRPRRIVSARALVSPRNGQHIYSFARIARLLGSDPRTIARAHLCGLLIISRRVPPDRTYVFRSLLIS